MFGYVKPFKPNLRMCEYDTYQAVYCGLCKVLGKKYGFAARMTLNYDFAFLGMLEFALSDMSFKSENQICIAHPLKKTPCLVCDSGELDFTAASSCILIYNKLRDDISDSRFLKKLAARFMLLFTSHAYRTAAKKYPQLAEYVKIQTEAQSALEKNGCTSIDKASEPSASILAEMMSYISDDNSQKALLKRFGYLLGRYIYIADAFDDIEKDFRSGSFNPLAVGNHIINDLDMKSILKKTEDSVNFTLGALADVYVQLDIKRFKPILDNIIYMGLKNSFYMTAEKKEALKSE